MIARATAIAACLAVTTLTAQAPVDLTTIERIRQEAIERSETMEHIWWLAEVHGPRVTGTPALAAASEWAMGKLKAWGAANVHQEKFAFGQGWVIEKFSANQLTPQPQILIGAPRSWSPSTKGPITADVVKLQASQVSDLDQHKGQLRGKIVIVQPARAVRMLEGLTILRMTEDLFKEASAAPAPAAARAPGSGGPSDAAKLQQATNAFLVQEGAAALLDRGSDSDMSPGGSDLSWQTQRTDGGTIFPGSGGSRDPKAPVQIPSATLAVEHYNRLVRLLDRKVPVQMELNIQTRFHPETDGANGINTIGEIRGSELPNEVVLLGAHLDGVPYATGATDNATGSAAMLEALRVIQTLGLKPRRTIRVALWGGEEQGLLGSRAYVQQHYFYFATNTPKPGHETLVAYFNLDNGTGRIRGIWGQGNMQALPLFERWGETVKDLGWRMASPRSVSSTDHLPFDQAGLPGFQFMQERLEYNSRSHHSNMDTFDRVQRDQMVQQGTVAAVFAWHAANAPERVPRKPMPAAKTSAQH